VPCRLCAISETSSLHFHRDRGQLFRSSSATFAGRTLGHCNIVYPATDSRPKPRAGNPMHDLRERVRYQIMHRPIFVNPRHHKLLAKKHTQETSPSEGVTVARSYRPRLRTDRPLSAAPKSTEVASHLCYLCLQFGQTGPLEDPAHPFAFAVSHASPFVLGILRVTGCRSTMTSSRLHLSHSIQYSALIPAMFHLCFESR